MAQEYKYAFYFPKLSNDCPSQIGYLWVGHLGSGIEGVVDLVMSATDGQLNARKRTFPKRPANAKFHSREAHFHRQHLLIPETISHTDCKVLRNWHKEAKEVKTTVIISQYCNGGTLAEYTDEFVHKSRPRTKLTESVIWRLFAAQLETLTFLHSGTPSLVRMDNHLENVFLHFPSN